MSDPIIIHKNRYNSIVVDLGYLIPATETFFSEIKTTSGELIVAFTVDWEVGGTELTLSLTAANTATPLYDNGIMDIKRVSSLVPYPVFDMPLEVEFRNSVTS